MTLHPDRNQGAGGPESTAAQRREWDRFMTKASLGTAMIKLREFLVALREAGRYARRSL